MTRRAGDEDHADLSVDRRLHALEALFSQVRTLEERAIRDDGLHSTLSNADNATAMAVLELTKAVNDPKSGLIVELSNFRTEVTNDRKVFKAQIRGAVVVLSFVFALVTWLAPYIQRFLELALS